MLFLKNHQLAVTHFSKHNKMESGKVPVVSDFQDILKRAQADAEEEEEELRKTSIIFTKLVPDAFIPKKFYENDAGYDLSALDKVIIHPKQCNRVHTGLSLKIPEGTYGRIVERSSIALKGMTVGGGVIDYGYTGEVRIIQ